MAGQRVKSGLGSWRICLHRTLMSDFRDKSDIVIGAQTTISLRRPDEPEQHLVLAVVAQLVDDLGEVGAAHGH
jgi:hypothetical protein